MSNTVMEKKSAPPTNWVLGLRPRDLIAQYDMFNMQREKLSREPNFNIQKIEKMTASINAMRDRIVSLMGE